MIVSHKLIIISIATHSPSVRGMRYGDFILHLPPLPCCSSIVVPLQPALELKSPQVAAWLLLVVSRACFTHVSSDILIMGYLAFNVNTVYKESLMATTTTRGFVVSFTSRRRISLVFVGGRRTAIKQISTGP